MIVICCRMFVLPNPAPLIYTGDDRPEKYEPGFSLQGSFNLNHAQDTIYFYLYLDCSQQANISLQTTTDIGIHV